MVLLLGVLVTIAVAVQFDGSSTVHGDYPHDGPQDQTAPDVDRASSFDNPTELLHVEWAQAGALSAVSWRDGYCGASTDLQAVGCRTGRMG